MKKAVFILGFLILFISNSLYAQSDSIDLIVSDSTEEIDESQDSNTVEEINEPLVEETVEEIDESTVEEVVEEETSVSQSLKLKFIEGGPSFMGIVLLCLILGLALCIERIIYLNKATTNADALLSDIEGALSSGNVVAAIEVCRNTVSSLMTS